MALTKATGTQVAIASAYSTAKTFTALSNAAEAVAAMATGHALVVGDYVEITSGWGLVHARIARVKTVAGDNVTLESINTTDTAAFPAGSSAGSLRKITTWTSITQITKDGGIGYSGGEPKYAPASTIDDDDDKEIPDGRTASKLQIKVYDDPSLAWYPIVDAIADADQVAALRLTAKNGSKTLANGYWSMPKAPAIQSGQVNSLTISFGAISRLTRYAT